MVEAEAVEEVEEGKVVKAVWWTVMFDSPSSMLCAWLRVCLCHGSSTSLAELAAAGLTDQRPLVSGGDARGADSTH